MKKLLIVGSCSAVVILILGAACAKLSGGEAKAPASFPFGKCSESAHVKAGGEGGCLESHSSDLHSELFLRVIKKKDRRVLV